MKTYQSPGGDYFARTTYLHKLKREMLERNERIAHVWEDGTLYEFKVSPSGFSMDPRAASVQSRENTPC